MTIKVSNFGDVLMSRPAGREAYLMAKAYMFKEIKADEDIVFDFEGIKVLAPSWADEFISGVKKDLMKSIQYINTENPSVKATLDFIGR